MSIASTPANPTDDQIQQSSAASLNPAYTSPPPESYGESPQTAMHYRIRTRPAGDEANSLTIPRPWKKSGSKSGSKSESGSEFGSEFGSESRKDKDNAKNDRESGPKDEGDDADHDHDHNHDHDNEWERPGVSGPGQSASSEHSKSRVHKSRVLNKLDPRVNQDVVEMQKKGELKEGQSGSG